MWIISRGISSHVTCHGQHSLPSDADLTDSSEPKSIKVDERDDMKHQQGAIQEQNITIRVEHLVKSIRVDTDREDDCHNDEIFQDNAAAGGKDHPIILDENGTDGDLNASCGSQESIERISFTSKIPHSLSKKSDTSLQVEIDKLFFHLPKH